MEASFMRNLFGSNGSTAISSNLSTRGSLASSRARTNVTLRGTRTFRAGRSGILMLAYWPTCGSFFRPRGLPGKPRLAAREWKAREAALAGASALWVESVRRMRRLKADALPRLRGDDVSFLAARGVRAEYGVD
jgi:hypothetical protein